MSLWYARDFLGFTLPETRTQRLALHNKVARHQPPRLSRAELIERAHLAHEAAMARLPQPGPGRLIFARRPARARAVALARQQNDAQSLRVWEAQRAIRRLMERHGW